MAPETALDQVERILQLIPLAGREAGVRYDELADALGVDRRQLERDLEALTDRDFYLPGGAVNDLQVILDDERVYVWTTGHLRRPTRLTRGEAAALDLGLRILAAERDEPGLPDRMRGLLERIARAAPADVAERVVADGDPGAADGMRALFADAVRARVRVAIRYVKPDADAPEDRTVEPWAVAHAEGRWYVIGRDPDADDARVFRLDRVLQATPDHATPGAPAFSPPADVDPADWLRDGRVYSAADETEVVVHYSRRVAPWLLERGEGEPAGDGGVVVRHRVADTGWVVRHVLGFGPEARVVGPGWVGELVREAAGRLEG